jgi:hypothetical protein
MKKVLLIIALMFAVPNVSLAAAPPDASERSLRLADDVGDDVNLAVATCHVEVAAIASCDASVCVDAAADAACGDGGVQFACDVASRVQHGHGEHKPAENSPVERHPRPGDVGVVWRAYRPPARH